MKNMFYAEKQHNQTFENIFWLQYGILKYTCVSHSGGFIVVKFRGDDSNEFLMTTLKIHKLMIKDMYV